MNLLSLLGQAIGVPISQGAHIPSGNPLDPNLGRRPPAAPVQEPPQLPDPSADISVTGSRTPVEQAPPPEPPPPPADIGDPNKITPRMLTQRQLDQRATPGNLPQHTGLYGAKGTLRDVLGLIGDAFLVQSGNKAVYAPRRQQEKISDAMVDYAQHPLDAIASTMAVDPETGFTLLKNFQDQGYRDQLVGVRKDANTIRSDANTFKQRDRMGTLFAQRMGAATPENYETVIKPQLERIKATGDLPDDFVIPDKFDPELTRAYQVGDMTTARQISARQGDRRLDIAERNAQTARISATRPRQAPVSHETSDERFTRVANDPGSASPGEREWYLQEREIRNRRGSDILAGPQAPEDAAVTRGRRGTYKGQTGYMYQGRFYPD